MADPIGLKKMRRNTRDRHPIHVCTNCSCTRYSPCKCTKGAAWTRKQHEAEQRERKNAAATKAGASFIR
jgi:hypothetical protein